jgi:hypothetical protein
MHQLLMVVVFTRSLQELICRRPALGPKSRRGAAPTGTVLDFTNGAFQETMQQVYFIRQITG